MNGRILIFTALFAGLGTIAFAQPPANISPANFPNGTYGSQYPNQQLNVTGGTPPYTFSISAGNLPPGLTLTADGVLSGTLTAAGKYSFTVSAQSTAPAGGPGNGGGPGGDGGGPGNGQGNGDNNDNGKKDQQAVTQDYTVTVTRVALTVTANDATMTYGGPLPSLGETITGFVNGDNVSTLNTAPVVNTTASAASAVGTYALTASGGADPDYSFTYRSGKLTIVKASLLISADNQSMSAGGPLPNLTVSYTGFVNRDKASSLAKGPKISTTATASSPAGTYPITASGASDPNYTITYAAGTLTVSAGTVHVTANAQTKEYGAPDPALTYTVTDLPTGADPGVITGSLSRAPGENAGSYPITIGSLSAGAKYKISYTGNVLTITQAPQQISWSQNLVVGCNATSQVQLNATASSNLPVSYSVSDMSVATVSGNVLTLLKPGVALITATQGGSGNYNAAQAVTDTIVYQPASLIAQHWNDAIFFDNSSGDYVGWQWYKNGAPVAGDTTPYYSETPSLDGQYYVIATNKDGQQVQSCTLSIAAGPAIAGGIRVFPNPAAGGAVVTLVSNYSTNTLAGSVVQITDISGQVLAQVTSVQPSMQITLPPGNGIFIINLLLSNGQRISTNVLVGK